jgi:hypothetical protein
MSSLSISFFAMFRREMTSLKKNLLRVPVLNKMQVPWKTARHTNATAVSKSAKCLLNV